VIPGLSITVLGCDGSYPGPGGACSGYLVRSATTSIWMDAGPGTLANLQRHLPIEEIDAVVITHEHVDHWSDLEHLAVACKWVVRRPPVPLYCEADLVSLLRSGSTEGVFDWNRIGPNKEVAIGDLVLSFSRTDHPVDTLAVRVDSAGRSLGYSADSGPDWDLAELGPGIHLAFCEATYLSDREGSLPHMSARQAGQNARAAGVERLVITHLWPRIDRGAAQEEAEVAFGGRVQVAATGARYEA
jgi:ribonuclease BN (tRNA processing enzyme)